MIIKPGAIGDILQLTPVVRALKKKYEHAHISLLLGSAATAALFKYNACVRDTIIFDKRGLHRSLRALVKLWRLVHEKKYDLVINFQRSNLKAWFLATSAFPCRLLVYHKSRAVNIHAVVNHLQTVSPLGIRTDDIGLELHTGPDEKAFATNIVAALTRPLVILNPGASHSVNRWSTDKFARLADLLAQQNSASIIIIGGADDVPLAEEISKKSSSKPLNLAGKTSLLQLGALLEHADVLVTGDTGPMHVATAVGTRVVALFGAADPARTGPVGPGHKVIQAAGVHCVPCRSRSCSNKSFLECMEKLSVDQVFKAVSELVKQGRGKGHFS